MRIVIAAAVMLCVVVSPERALAQVQPPQDRINTALARAQQVGIPLALLESKIAEGKAKGVSLERLAAAIERRMAALERASQVLEGRPDVTPADLAVAADALESGVSDTVLGTLAASAPQARRTVAIAVLAQLVELGHPPDVALERVRAALERGPEALLNLPVEAGLAGGRRGGPPDRPTPGTSGGGRGPTQVGPPASVPAPGQTTQPTRPRETPSSSTPGPPTTPPAAGRGGAGGS
jgi:hypothetical protein